MKRLTLAALPADNTPRAVALGLFDGIHIGHRTVLRAAADALRQDPTVIPTVFTFRTLPKMEQGGRLLSEADADRLLDTIGIRETVVADFESLRRQSPEQFVREILRDALHARFVFCGENFRFGLDGAGDAAQLKALGERFHIAVTVVPAFPVDGRPVSSTRIREAIRQGDFAAANRLLGHPYTIHSAVIHGRHLGHTLGTPTINQPWLEGGVLPPFGVYASEVEIDGRCYAGVTNIGVKPTVGSDRPLAETWIPDYDGDLYGQTVPVRPVTFLRLEMTFDSLESLRRRIVADGETVRRLNTDPHTARRAILFDFDDTLQNRRRAFESFCLDFCRRHFPALSADDQARRAADMAARNQNGYVNYDTYCASLLADYDGWDTPLTVADLREDLRRFFPVHTQLLPGAADGLQALRDAGWTVGLITNGDARQQNTKLDFSGLRGLFDLAVVSGDEGVHKPNPELFRRAAMRLGLPPARCIYVGDHPINDMQGAREAGMHTVFMQASGSFPPPPAVPVVGSMAELLEHLPRLCAEFWPESAEK